MIADSKDASVAPGETGEILCRGDVVMAGYWRDPEGFLVEHFTDVPPGERPGADSAPRARRRRRLDWQRSVDDPRAGVSAPGSLAVPTGGRFPARPDKFLMSAQTLDSDSVGLSRAARIAG